MHHPNDSNSIHNPQIKDIIQINEDELLIGTIKGLSIYNYNTNKFRKIKIDSTLSNYNLKNFIKAIVPYKNSEYIIGTKDGLMYYDAKSKKLSPIKYGSRNLLSNWQINSLFIDRRGNLWAGAQQKKGESILQKLFKCNLNRLSVLEYSQRFDGGSNQFYGISEDYLGNIWASTDSGLISINPLNNKQTFYKAPNNFYSNIAHFHTKDNIILQSFWSFGVTAFDIDKKEFKVIAHDPENPKSLLSNKNWALFKDENDIIWIGSDVGLQKITNRKPNVEVIKRNYTSPNKTFLSNIVSNVNVSRLKSNTIFVGIDGEGFSIYNKASKESENFGPNATTKNNERFVNHFLELENGDVFVSGQTHFQKLVYNSATGKYNIKTFFKRQENYVTHSLLNPLNKNEVIILGNGQLIFFNIEKETFEFIKEPNGIKTLFESSITKGEEIYFTTANNLLKYNLLTKTFETFSIPNSGRISSATATKENELILTSQYLGLIKFNTLTKKFETLYGLNNNFFTETKFGVRYKSCIWVGTNNGLLKYNFQTGEHSQITANDGLPSEIINSIDIVDGYFYIGTQEGLVIFNPDYQGSHFNLPKVDVTNIEGLSSNFEIRNIKNGQEIELKQNQNSFRINFTLLDFNLPEKNSYKFRFTPLLEDWASPIGEHFVIYNALDAGTYKFELMGANADQSWCAEPFVITIKIVPPFYKARWFFYLVIILGALFILIFTIIRSRAIKRNTIKLEKIIKDRTQEIEGQRATLMDSINYAQRLQRAIFVGQEILKDVLKESFIYYRPKDKISGDFFWIGKHKDMLIVFSGDCTGHGVPGALLSIVGTSLLNKIIYEENVFMPGEILTRLNYLFFHQLQLKEDNLRDGMDGSVLVVNLVNNNVFFAGAKNDAYVLQNNTITTIKADRFSIGENDTNDFKTIKLDYEPNRYFYLTSDGIKDQFGSNDNKRFTVKRFRDLLLSVYQMPFNEQPKEISKTIKTWRGSVEQTDDIIMIGFKF